MADLRELLRRSEVTVAPDRDFVTNLRELCHEELAAPDTSRVAEHPGPEESGPIIDLVDEQHRTGRGRGGPEQPNGRASRRRIAVAAAAAVALVVGTSLLVRPANDNGIETTPPAGEVTVASSSTASTTVNPAELQPVQVARDFLDAYSDGDADRALTYLTEDSTGGGYTNTYWSSPETFRLDVAMAKAQHIEEMFTGCAEQGDSAAGTTVRCTFDMHAYRSDEVGRGPYSGNYWDVVVRDGKITSAVATWAYLTNGVSAEMWQPFQAWLASTHPEDVQTLSAADVPITEESIRLWEWRLAEWAATVNSGSP